MSLIVLFVIVHIIGAIITIIIHCKNGTMEAASKYGDGIRLARPSDVIFIDCAAWEILWLMRIVDDVDYYINMKIEEHFNYNEDNK
jgi:hypothetical protein